MANENKKRLISEAKIISAYTQQPIFDLDKWSISKLRHIYQDMVPIQLKR